MPAPFAAMINARVSLRQAGQVAALAEAASCSEAEVVRYALSRLFGGGGAWQPVPELEQELVRLVDADEDEL